MRRSKRESCASSASPGSARPLRLALVPLPLHHRLQLGSMAKVSYPHYAWAGASLSHLCSPPTQAHPQRAGGHFVVLLGTIYSLLGLVTFSARPKSYSLAYTGALLSWGIVVVRPISPPPRLVLAGPC